MSFGDSAWNITRGGRLVLARAAKSRSLYPLVVFGSLDHVLFVDSIPHVSLWHACLGHMSLKGIEMLSAF